MIPTVGVEEEFLLVDPETGRPVPRAEEVLALGPVDLGGATLQPELSSAQVESATGVCANLTELETQLRELRTVLASRAHSLGALLLAAGVPIVGGTVPLAPGERFAGMGEVYGRVLTDYLCCACQVHVAVPGRDEAVGVVDRIRRWLPTLLAVSVNSPLYDGQDTGYGSWRTVMQGRFPGGGIPPRFGSVTNYGHLVGTLVDAGVLLDDRMTFWLARPSPAQPTVEFRVADAAVDVESAVLQAALARALVQQELADLAAGRPAPGCDDTLAAAALWSAARYGIGGPAIDPATGRRMPAVVLLADLLDLVRPALEASGDLGQVRALVERLLTTGTGADRQRAAAAAGGSAAALEALAVTASADREVPA